MNKNPFKNAQEEEEFKREEMGPSLSELIDEFEKECLLRK